MVASHQVVEEVTARVIARSHHQRRAYLERLAAAADEGPHRGTLSCTNLAHAFAASGADKPLIKGLQKPNIAIVSAYNDMLSAHQPLEHFPVLLKQAVRDAGGTAQFAGGVPAMCDGVTQGQSGMELSLFSRDVIAMATAVALSHNAFDGVFCLGVCDKIVPGLLIGALHFGHLPCIFVPAGPMTSGLSNPEKARVRALFAEGRIDRAALLEAESQSYHGPGTCTFYGTANSNQMLMEVMGLHLPGAAFINPNTPLRDAMTIAAGQRIINITAQTDQFTPVGRVIDERALVNGIVGLLATGGSTNHTIHLIAIARAAGITLTWQDFSDLSAVVPLLARIYPNGEADVNHFHAAGGMGLLVRELLAAGLLHDDVLTVAGQGMTAYAEEPVLADGGVAWREAPDISGDESVLRGVKQPFSKEGGLRVLEGNIGRAVIKVSAVDPAHRVVEAPARVFTDQLAVLEAFRAGELTGDFVCVVRGQGPKANGMPELHKLSPELGVLQARGQKVALITDGRMSGASGKVPAAIHISPEWADSGAIGRIRDGDLIRLDAENGVLSALVAEDEWQRRDPAMPESEPQYGMGRELFRQFRAVTTSAESGAVSWNP
ncbi:MAG: phosphogluconate dehydratase [Gammaproteobacteria bacterium]|nr:phosphogluconate dehydratase [Gammaproteobacteria bacterium]